MRISIVLGPFHEPPPRGFGAVEKVWWALAHELARVGHEVCVVAKGHPLGRATEAGVEKRFLPGFVASGRIALDLAKDFAYALRVLLELPRADVVVTNTFWLPVLLPPLKRSKGRIVVHVGRFPKGQMFLYRGADLVHTVSSCVAEAIERECPALRERIRVIGYPVDVRLFAPRPDAPRGYGILYVGRIHPEKGVHLLIAAFRRVCGRVAGATLSIVGPAETRAGGGGPRYMDRLRLAAAGLPVRFEPAIADEVALAARYCAADLFCYPSLAERGETFGRAVLEAMSCGLPCVVSSLACFTDFLEDGRHGLVFDHRATDAEDRLADALAAVLSDRPRATAMSAAARERALRHSTGALGAAYAAMLAGMRPT